MGLRRRSHAYDRQAVQRRRLLIHRMNNKNTKLLSINDFSAHLFWDVDREKLSLPQNKSFIIQRVLEYGVLNDWQLIKDKIGINEIADVAVELGNLDFKALSFISLVSGVPKEKFRCYTTQQSSLKHWDF